MEIIGFIIQRPYLSELTRLSSKLVHNIKSKRTARKPYLVIPTFSDVQIELGTVPS